MTEDVKNISAKGADNELVDKEISILDILAILYRFKLFIISFVFIISLSSVVYSLTVTPLYKAEVLVFPAEENHTGGLQGSMGSSLQLLMPQLSSSTDDVSKHLSILEKIANLFRYPIRNRRKLSVSFIEKNTLEIKIDEKFVRERGRINCSLREDGGFWRWLGIQFVIAEK